MSAQRAAERVVNEALRALSEVRPVFYSEADLQHALAWTINLLSHDAELRLEVPLLESGRERLDVYARVGGTRLAIELKYPRAPFLAEVDGEPTSYRRKSADAVDDTRYAVVQDVHRLERLVDEDAADVGVLLLLTNNAAFWKQPSRPPATLDRAFRVHEESWLGGDLVWADGGRAKDPVALRGKYTCKWKDYSRLAAGTGSLAFRSLMLQIA